MRKHFFAALLAIVMCLAVVLSGCSLTKSLEKDIQVVLENEGEYVGTYTVNIFNNAVVPEQTKAGYKFVGWSAKEDWTEGVDSTDLLTENTGLIRYDDIKDYVVGESQSVTLYAAYTAIPRRDLVIAWYDKETTSGLNQGYMDAFRDNLYAYLTTEGYTPESMDIVIRGYAGDVGTTCSEIMKDGDVDIMVGWSSTGNLTGTGGLVEGTDFIENNGGVLIGAKERYAARISDTELCKLVYTWIFEEYSDTPLTPDPEPTPDPDPTPDPEPTPDATRLVVAWYDLPATSGLNDMIISAFTKGLEDYLVASSYTLADITLDVRGYEGDVETSCGAIMQDGDVDIMLGWGGNIGSKGGMTEGTDYLEHVSGIPMGGETRYITRNTDTEIVNLVFDWLQTADAQAYLAEPAVTDTKLVVGWYGKTSTTGLDQTIIDGFTAALNAYIAELGFAEGEVEVVVREYAADLDVAGVGTAVNTDGDVDILLGMGNNITTTGKIETLERVDDYAMGEKSRNIARLTDDILTVTVFDWLQTDAVRALFVA